MLGNINPSVIVNKIYDILEDYEIKTDIYEHGVIDAIADYLGNHLKIEYLIYNSDWPNEEGGVCAISFIDSNHPQLVVFDYEY